MSDSPIKNESGNPGNLPPTYTLPLRKRTPSEQEAYWAGFRAGLEASIHGIEASLKRFELSVELSRQAQRPRDN